MLEQLLTGRLMDKLRPGWRERSAAQKGWWHLGEVTVVVGLTLILCWQAIRFAVRLHLKYFPDDATFLKTSLFKPDFLSVFALLLTAALLLCVSGILVNSFEGLIPALKRRSEKGSDRLPGLTISDANRGLIWASVVCAVPAFPTDAVVLFRPWAP